MPLHGCSGRDTKRVRRLDYAYVNSKRGPAGSAFDSGWQVHSVQ